MLDSKSSAARLEGSSPSPGTKELLAFIIGVALGDGNLSNPNNRAVRLRVTCDKRYPNIINEVQNSISSIMPNNKVSFIHRNDNCIDISCYSNKWESLLGWYANKGSKYTQQVHVPTWIHKNERYIKECLRGLILTDGSIYSDRGYKMVNFTTIIQPLAEDVQKMINSLGYTVHTQTNKQKTKKTKYVVRISKNSKDFIKELNINKT